jgi:hypothetical protein
MARRKSKAQDGMRRRYWVAIAALWIVMLMQPVQAEEPPTFSISIGAFFTDRDTNTRIDASPTDTGTDINLEGDLGFRKSDNVFRFDGYWRFATNHRLDVSAFDLSRTSTKLIDRDITIGDTTYDLGTSVDAKLDLNIYKVAYTWMFKQRGRNFLGASAGLYIADIGASFAGALGINPESNDITAPLPVFGLRGAYHFAERWSIRGSAELFLFELNSFDGSFYDVFGGIDYSMTDMISLGLGFNAVKFDLGFNDRSLTGDLDWGYAGAMLYLKFDF